MKDGLCVVIREVENGYVVHEDRPGQSHGGYLSKNWVAGDDPALIGELIASLAAEAREPKKKCGECR